MREIVIFPGQRVVLTSGETAVVAFVAHNQVWAFGRLGLPMPVSIVGDAWGGEHDQTIGLAVA